ncbi:ATPase, F1/V1/A1 complex, alpha/beta subunit [Tanacetum coccineum]
MGKPLVMDNVTVEMYKTGIGRVRYARVLVEVSTKKILPNEIKVVYRDKNKVKICRKTIMVKYDWIPPRCSECRVFGHKEGVCGKNKAGGIHNEGKEEVQEQKGESSKSKENNDFTEVRNRKENGAWIKGMNNNQKHKQNHGKGMRNEKPVNQFVFQKKNKEGQDRNNILSSPSTKAASEAKVQDEKVMRPNGNDSRGKAWSEAMF